MKKNIWLAVILAFVMVSVQPIAMAADGDRVVEGTVAESIQTQALTVEGTTNDGSTSPLVVKDSDGSTVFSVSTDGDVKPANVTSGVIPKQGAAGLEDSILSEDGTDFFMPEESSLKVTSGTDANQRIWFHQNNRIIFESSGVSIFETSYDYNLSSALLEANHQRRGDIDVVFRGDDGICGQNGYNLMFDATTGYLGLGVVDDTTAGDLPDYLLHLGATTNDGSTKPFVIEDSDKTEILSVNSDGVLDLPVVTDNNLPKVGASGFEDSAVTDDGTTVTVTEDIDQNGNRLIQSQSIADLTAGKAGASSYFFDGVDDYVSASFPTIDWDAGGSLITSFAFRGVSTNNCPIIASTSSTSYYLKYVNTGYLIGETNTNGDYFLNEPWTFDTNNHILAFSGTGNTVTSYLDGAVFDSNVVTDNSTYLYLGRQASEYSNVNISSVRLFNLALDPTDATDNAIINGGSVPFKYAGASQTELVTDGDMSNAGSWTTNGTATVDDGGSDVAELTGDGTADNYFYQSMGTGPLYGKAFRVTYDITANTLTGGTEDQRLQLPANALQSDAYYLDESVGSHSLELIGDISGTTYAQMKLVSSVTGGSISIDNFSVTQIGCVADYNPSGITSTKWIDNSGNNLDGTVSGAIVTNPAAGLYIAEVGASAPKFEIDETGQAVFQNTTDSTTGFQVKDADGGTPVLNVDTTNERVGVGTAAPETKLNIVQGSAGLVGLNSNTVLGVESDSTAAISILTPNNKVGQLIFGDTDSNAIGRIDYNHSAPEMRFFVEGSQAIEINSSLNIGLNQTTFGTSAAKVLAIGDGTAPTTSPADATQTWSDDQNGVDGKNRLYQRTEDGTSGPVAQLSEVTETVNTKMPSQAVELTAASTGSTGIVVADNDNIDFGTGDFTLVWRGSLPDWISGSGMYIMMRSDNGFSVAISTAGYIQCYFADAGASYNSVANTFIDGTVHEIVVSVDNGTSIAYYVDGKQLGSSVAIPSIDVDSGTSLYISGTNAIRTASRTEAVYTYNRALSADEVADLYKNGPKYEDKWGSQTAVYESDFSANEDGWTGTRTTVTGNIDGIDGEDDCLRITCNSDDNSHLANLTSTMQSYKKYRLKFKYYIPSTNSNVDGFYMLSSGGYAFTPNPGAHSTLDSWTSINIDVLNLDPINNRGLRASLVDGSSLTFADAGADDVIYIKDVEITPIGATLALQPENIQTDKWYDSSTNGLTASYPTAGESLVRPTPIGQETLLSLTMLPLNADGDTTLYTVPTGRRCVLTKAILVAGADAASTDLTIGQDTAESDWLATTQLDNLDAEFDSALLMPVPAATEVGIKSYAAGTVIQANVANQAGGATNYLYLYGVLY